MTKLVKKGKKLDSILAEVTAIKSQLRKLIKQQAALTDGITKLGRLKANRKPRKISQPRPQARKRVKKKTPTRPVLVQTSEAVRPTGAASP